MEALVSEDTANGGRAPAEARAILGNLSADGLILELTGQADEDWKQLSRLRPIPRGISVGYAEQQAEGLIVLSPAGQRQVMLDPAAFAIWCQLDGAATLSAAVRAAIEDTGLVPSYMRARCQAMLLAGMSAGILLVDM